MIIANKWEIEKGEIYTVVTNAGEFVGRIEFTERSVVRMKKPLLLMADPNSTSQQFIPTVSMTGENDPEIVEFNSNSVILITKTHSAYAADYVKATSGIVLPRGK